MKIIGIGQNYANHVKEMGAKIPEQPLIFLKPDSALLRNNDNFYYPDFTNEIHYECEIVVRIDKAGKHITPEFAPSYYSKIALGIDFTARDIQAQAKKSGTPWTLAKGFDGSAPISEFVNLSEIDDPQNLPFRLEKNGTIVQNGNTNDMIFKINELIAYVSSFISFKKGDLIYTGTPSGVGPIEIGDKLVGYIEDKKLLDFEIK